MSLGAAFALLVRCCSLWEFMCPSSLPSWKVPCEVCPFDSRTKNRKLRNQHWLVGGCQIDEYDDSEPSLCWTFATLFRRFDATSTPPTRVNQEKKYSAIPSTLLYHSSEASLSVVDKAESRYYRNIVIPMHVTTKSLGLFSLPMTLVDWWFKCLRHEEFSAVDTTQKDSPN